MRPLTAIFVPHFSGNPYLDQLGEHLSAAGVRVVPPCRSFLAVITGLVRYRPQLLHLHWLQGLYQSKATPAAVAKFALSLCGLRLLRFLGVRIVWTVHNLHDHELKHPTLDRLCTAFIVRRADAIIVHCREAKRLLALEFPVSAQANIVVIPHGTYGDVYENRISRSDARRDLGLDDERVVFLFLGQIRPYKGVVELIDAFAALEQGDVDLVIAGKPRDQASDELIRARCREQARVHYHPGFVPDDRIQVYMNACDAVVLPYRDILTSGGAVLAMSFGRACIAPRIGCIPEMLDESGAFLYEPNDPDGLRKALELAAAQRGKLAAMGNHNRRSIEPWDWQRVARMTLNVYRDATGAAPLDDRAG